MMSSLFNGQRNLALRNNVEILALRAEVERYKYFSQLMNLYGKFTMEGVGETLKSRM